MVTEKGIIMKRFCKIYGLILATILMTFMMSASIFAAGSLTATADKDSCANGDTVTVSIQAEADAASTIPPQITVEFNSNRLSFENCSAEYGGGGGGLITINDTAADITFTTISGGTAVVDVSAVLDEDATDIQKTSIIIAVDGEDTAIGTDTVASTDTGVMEGVIDAGDGRAVQAVFAEEFMPILFHKATAQYQGQTVECAQYDMADLTLLYTTDTSGQDGKFCMYNVVSGELSDFRMIQGIENRFIIVLNECDSDIPEGYTKAVLDWNGQTLTAYMNVEAASGNETTFGGLSANDFFLVYGLSSEGSKGWYQYDRVDGTYQRFLQVTSGAGATSEDESASGNDTDNETFLDEYLSGQVQMILLFVFFGLALILLIVVIVLAVKCADYNNYEYIDPDEYYQDEEEEYVRPVRGGRTAASIVNQSMNDEEDDEDETDSEEDDNEEDVRREKAAVVNEQDDEEAESDDEMPKMNNPYEEMARNDRKQKRVELPEDMFPEEGDEMEEDYFDPRMSRKERKAYEKQLRREEKEAAKEEKWRLKEEKKAAKMRNKGYEEASPMDWSSFGEDLNSREDDRRPMGKGNMPKYMTGEEDISSSETVQEDINSNNYSDENYREEIQEEPVQEEKKLPPRKLSPEMSEMRAAESAKALKEDELRKKQKRLFEQQQRLEEQRRIQEEQEREAMKKEQQSFVMRTAPDEDLDEDFQFEFLNL